MEKSRATWPLWLSAPHRQLIMANIVGESILQESQDADDFLVNSFIAGISHSYQDMELILKGCSKDKTAMLLEEGIPLSLSNSRLFGAAVLRLPKVDQLEALSSLLSVLSSGLAEIKADGSKYELLCQNEECSGFVSRTIALCTSLAIALTCSNRNLQLPQKLVEAAKVLQQPAYLPSNQPELQVFQPEKYFVSLFDHRGSLNFIESDLSLSSMDQDQSETLQAVLKQAFSMSFSTAPADRCYLMFASWNALGKSGLWIQSKRSIALYNRSLPDDLSSLILELRDEMCYINHLIWEVDSNHACSSLSCVVFQNDFKEASRKHIIATAVAAMVVKASSICEDLLCCYVLDDPDMEQEIPPQVHALLEGLSVYLSFAIASHTRPDSDFFTYLQARMNEKRMQKRTRGYSSESENYASEASSMASRDVPFEATDQLEHACAQSGVVPAHPDWLDSDCDLRENITPCEARDAAVLALETLTKLAKASWRHAQLSQIKSLGPRQPCKNGAERAELASNLCRLQHLVSPPYSEMQSNMPDETNTTGRDLSSDISALCGIDKRVIDLWLETSPSSENHQSAKAYWICSTSQRVLGSLHNIIQHSPKCYSCPELRAAGEWECLFGLTLTMSAINFSREECSVSDDVVHFENLVASKRWRGIHHSALHALAPAAALLHLSLRTSGRKQHPCKSLDFPRDAFDPLSLAEVVPMSFPPAESVEKAIFRTLAVLSFCSNVQDRLSEAIASNLIADSKAFKLLRGVSRSKYVLKTLPELQLVRHVMEKKLCDAACGLCHALGLVLVGENGLHKANSKHTKYNLSGLKAAVGAFNPPVATMTGGTVGVFESMSYLEPDGADVSIAAIIPFLWHDCSYIRSPTRLLFLRILCILAGDETKFGNGSHILMNHISALLRVAPKRKLKALVEKDICEGTTSGTCPLVCALLASTLSTDGDSISISQCELVFDRLSGLRTQWIHWSLDCRAPVLDLFFLLGCRLGKLNEIVIQLAEGLREETDQVKKLENLARFSTFLHELQSHESKEISKPHNKIVNAPKLLSKCSHAETTGFQDQHWYHCYTCGLTLDKGCCTLCALICHQGHDVSYSRFSAFFCDCGAESEDTSSTRRLSCKCLSALSPEEISKAYGRDKGNVEASSAPFPSSTSLSQEQPDMENYLLSVSSCAALATHFFPAAVKESIDILIKQGQHFDWKTTFLECVNDRFQAYRAEVEKPVLPTEMQEEVLTYSSIQKSLLQRKPTAAVMNGSGPLLPIVHFMPGSFHPRFSSDSAIDSLRRVLLSTNGTCRYAMEADSRGRLIAAESNSLVIFTALPALNAAALGNLGTTQSRASVAFLGNATLDFNIVGLKLCRFNQSCLLVWGTHEAVICTLDEATMEFSKTYQLELGLASGPLESASDFVIKCEWLPGPSGSVYVACLRSILFFNVSSTAASKNPVPPSSAVRIGTDACFRGVVATMLRDNSAGSIRTWKIFALMDDGRLHGFHLALNESCKLTISNLNLDSSQSTKLPISGNGTSPLFSLTLGEGVQLAYLEKSQMILYQAAGESVLSLQVDGGGTIVSSFTLLPVTLSKDVTGSEAEIRPVIGPYTNWIELGAVHRGSSTYFRVSCIGRRSGKPVCLLIDFNEKETSVCELPWDAASISGTSSSLSVLGLAAFSSPFTRTNDPLQHDLASGYIWKERIFLAALLGNGSLHIFGEEIEKSLSALCVPNPQHGNSTWIPPGSLCSNPLLAFEELSNVTETGSNIVSFHGLGIGRYAHNFSDCVHLLSVC